MLCSHPLCAVSAGYERGGFLLCFHHFLMALQWEQPRAEDVAA